MQHSLHCTEKLDTAVVILLANYAHHTLDYYTIMLLMKAQDSVPMQHSTLHCLTNKIMTIAVLLSTCASTSRMSSMYSLAIADSSAWWSFCNVKVTTKEAALVHNTRMLHTPYALKVLRPSPCCYYCKLSTMVLQCDSGFNNFSCLRYPTFKISYVCTTVQYSIP
jgi:hypothetical protein